MDCLSNLLDQVMAKNLRVNVEKVVLLAHEAEFCGRIVSNAGWKFNEEYYNKILQTPKPEFTWQLAQLVHLGGWISQTLPNYAEIRDAFTGVVELNAKKCV